MFLLLRQSECVFSLYKDFGSPAAGQINVLSFSDKSGTNSPKPRKMYDLVVLGGILPYLMTLMPCIEVHAGVGVFDYASCARIQFTDYNV